MKHVTISDVVKKPSVVINASEVIIIVDAKRHITKSVVIPYTIYEKLEERVEEEIYLLENSKALGMDAYETFKIVDEAGAEDMPK
jgi:hypothetical protein